MGNAGPVVLVVDDDLAVLRMQVRGLEEFELVQATNGLAARQILSESAVDVVVCDLEMPGLSGLELLNWAKEHCPGPAWIMVSGRGTLDTAVQALKLGAFDFICKPMESPVQLRTAVANAARQKALLADVAERRAREIALRESERQVRQLVENIPDLAWSADADGHIGFYNRSWYEYTGSTLEQMEGWGWQSVHRPDMLGQVIERWTRALATGDPFEMEFPLRRADGIFRWFLTRVRPLRGADGPIVGWFGTNTDIDEAKRALSEREKLILELERALEMRDEFLSVASHELRTPLTALQLQLQGAVHNLGRTTSLPEAKFRGKLEVAIRQTQHLSVLVNRLLDVAQCSQGHLPLDLDEVDLVAIVRFVIEQYAPQALVGGCAITLNGDSQLVGLWDRARMEQVITNLVMNSIKYAPGHPIDASVRLVDGCAQLVVEDYGVGIRPEDASRIFSRFERAVSSKHFGGLGLGLYVTRQIVEAHGGTIGVESEVDHGATFTVKVPLRPALSPSPDRDLSA